MGCQLIIPDSSMVEHAAVNRGVVGSSPTRGAGYAGTFRRNVPLFFRFSEK